MKVIRLVPDTDGTVPWPVLDKEKRSVVTIGTFDGVHKGHAAVIRRTAELAEKYGSFSVVIMFDPRPSFVHSHSSIGPGIHIPAAPAPMQGDGSPQGSSIQFGGNNEPDPPDPEDPEAVSSAGQRIQWIRDLGIQYLLIVRYTPGFARQTYINFLGQLVGKLGMRTLVLGADARFGRGLEGNVKTSRNVAASTGVFEVDAVEDQGRGFTWVFPDVQYHVPDSAGEPANPLDSMSRADRRAWTKKHHMVRVRDWSSSHVRDALAGGRIAEAAEVLGRSPQIRGEVVHGEARGRQLGFPTANLGGTIEGLIPVDGVYAGYVTDAGHRWPAAVSVGTKETFHDAADAYPVPERVVEAYIIDETGLDLYGHTITIEFTAFMRPQTRFGSSQELIAQLGEDSQRAKAIISGRSETA